MYPVLHRLTYLIAALALLLPLACMTAYGEEAGTLMRIPSARAAATIPVFVHSTEGAKTTVVLLPGGGRPRLKAAQINKGHA